MVTRSIIYYYQVIRSQSIHIKDHFLFKKKTVNKKNRENYWKEKKLVTHSEKKVKNERIAEMSGRKTL